jgi:hypothetical protein
MNSFEVILQRQAQWTLGAICMDPKQRCVYLLEEIRSVFPRVTVFEPEKLLFGPDHTVQICRNWKIDQSLPRCPGLHREASRQAAYEVAALPDLNNLTGILADCFGLATGKRMVVQTRPRRDAALTCQSESQRQTCQARCTQRAVRLSRSRMCYKQNRPPGTGHFRFLQPLTDDGSSLQSLNPPRRVEQSRGS